MLNTAICASGSAVEHLLAKERVAGSIPVSRSWQISQIMFIYVICHIAKNFGKLSIVK